MQSRSHWVQSKKAFTSNGTCDCQSRAHCCWFMSEVKDSLFLTLCRKTGMASPEISAHEVIITSAHSERGARASIDEDLLFASIINLPSSCRLLSFCPLSRTDYAATQKWQSVTITKETNEQYWLYRTKTAIKIRTDWTNFGRCLLKVIFFYSQSLSSKLKM